MDGAPNLSPRPDWAGTADAAGLRVALYYAPAPSDPLWQAGCRWLGRDPQTGVPLPQPDLPDVAAITADARGYGFHATLKPPMRLAGGWRDFLADARALAATIAPFELPALRVGLLGDFLALLEQHPSRALRAFADACVAGLDRHRAPPSAAELARRRQGDLSPERAALLQRWGYPDVFDAWRFHMTLSRRLAPAEAALWQPAATAYFAPALALPRRVGELCIFTQDGPGSPFLMTERLPLAG